MSVATHYTPAIADRVSALDWQEITEDLDNYGCATANSVLTPDECRSLVGIYDEETHFIAGSSWSSTASVVVNTNTLPILFRKLLPS
ncbi:MAG: hypothetical protein WBL40_15390 [Terrimicrobiaceae bacterium]